MQHSLERRRTVDLHHEPVSERTIFKTQMTALGCAVLFGTLVLMLGYLAIASVIPLNGTLLIVLRMLVFAPLVLFLLAQLLLPLSLTSPENVDVALVTSPEGDAYHGHTVLGLDLAYARARQIARPEEWRSAK